MTQKSHVLAAALMRLHHRDVTDTVRDDARATIYEEARQSLLPRCRHLLERHPSPTARDAEDLVSDALVAILFAASRARCVAQTDAAVIAYLQQAITRDWLDERRRDSGQHEGPYVDVDAARCIDGLYASVPFPPDRRRALHRVYAAALAEVPPAFGKTWRLVVHEGHTTESAGAVLGVARSTISNRCAKVRQHLQPRLASFLPTTRTRDQRGTAGRTEDLRWSPTR